MMRGIENESIDLVFADPPFNVGKQYGEGFSDKNVYYWSWCKSWVHECFRVLKSTGSIYIMTLSRHSAAFRNMLDKRGVFINEIIWKNVSSVNNKKVFGMLINQFYFMGNQQFYLQHLCGNQKRTITLGKIHN